MFLIDYFQIHFKARANHSVNDSSTVVEHLPHHRKVEGLTPREGENEKNLCAHFLYKFEKKIIK